MSKISHHSDFQQTPPEVRLWQHVLFQAFTDATYEGTDKDMIRERGNSHYWITHSGRGFRQVCSLAGMDADFLRDAYIRGKINRTRLKSGH